MTGALYQGHLLHVTVNVFEHISKIEDIHTDCSINRVTYTLELCVGFLKSYFPSKRNFFLMILVMSVNDKKYIYLSEIVQPKEKHA